MTTRIARKLLFVVFFVPGAALGQDAFEPVAHPVRPLQSAFLSRAPVCAVLPVPQLPRPLPEIPQIVRLRWPVESRLITSDFGRRVDPVAGHFTKKHKGVDIRCPTGTPVVATADGVVTYARRSGRGGLMVKIRHGEKLVTRYAHLSRILVRKGDLVRAGERIAFSGSSGRVTGPHLHFEIWDGRKAKDPLDFAWQLPEDPFLAPPHQTVSANRF